MKPPTEYPLVLSAVARSLWAILPEKGQAVLEVLALRAAGHRLSHTEIRARIGTPRSGGTESRSGAVAVIPLRGVIAHRMSMMDESSGGMSAERFTRMVQTAAADPGISAIVLDVDSPGGTVNGIADAAQAVYDARQTKRVVAVANGQMASAAYWVSSQADEIVAAPGLLDTSIGSIGVYTIHTDTSSALEKAGIKPTIISAGKYKTAGNPFEPLSAEERANMQGRVDAAYNAFISDVARGRGVSPSAVRNGYGEGRALSAVDAKRAGLVDRIASMDETIRQAQSAGPRMLGQPSAMRVTLSSTTDDRLRRLLMR